MIEIREDTYAGTRDSIGYSTIEVDGVRHVLVQIEWAYGQVIRRYESRDERIFELPAEAISEYVDRRFYPTFQTFGLPLSVYQELRELAPLTQAFQLREPEAVISV